MFWPAEGLKLRWVLTPRNIFFSLISTSRKSSYSVQKKTYSINRTILIQVFSILINISQTLGLVGHSQSTKLVYVTKTITAKSLLLKPRQGPIGNES